jgi:hypothetical protein
MDHPSYRDHANPGVPAVLTCTGGADGAGGANGAAAAMIAADRRPVNVPTDVPQAVIRYIHLTEPPPHLPGPAPQPAPVTGRNGRLQGGSGPGRLRLLAMPVPVASSVRGWWRP